MVGQNGSIQEAVSLIEITLIQKGLSSPFFI